MRGILKAARTRAFEAALEKTGLTLDAEEALESSNLELVAAAAWIAPRKVLQTIIDGIDLNAKPNDRADLILFIEQSRGCSGCKGNPRRCHACERVLGLYQELGLTVPEHLG